jgi:hypothetical protein
MRTDNRRTISSRDISLTPADDRRHTLKSGEHEAFYFPFTSPEGNLFGFMRTLFDQDIVLEIRALVAVFGYTNIARHFRTVQ